jgi:hypothetical protein
LTRPPLHKLEKFMLAVVVAEYCSLAFGLWMEPWTFTEGGVLLRLGIVVLCLLAAVGFMLLVMRSAWGLVLLALFHGLQVPQWTLGDHWTWQFSFSPTVFAGVMQVGEFQLRANLVALLFTALCFPAWQLRRAANLAGAWPAPSDS